MKKFLAILLCICVIVPAISSAQSLGNRLKGKLLLQVEQGGRIWYVAPKDEKRYEVTFANALPLFEQHALGISNNDLNKIPIAINSVSNTIDSDNDGFNDQDEVRRGYNPFGNGKLNTSVSFGKNLSGKLLLQVEQGGRIWYVDFDGYRWEVTWENLMNLFKRLSLGISNNDLNKIPSPSEPTTVQESDNDDDYVEDTTSYEDTSSSNTPTNNSTTQNPVSSSKPAILQLLEDVDKLSPSQIASLYNSLSAQERNWFEIETMYGNFIHLLVCQEDLNFTTKSYDGTVFTCQSIIQSYQQSLQYISEAQLQGNIEESRLTILNGYNCDNGSIDQGTCNSYNDALQNFQAGDRQTFQTINDNLSGACRIGVDPNCY